jgi:hypothetical protein
VSRQRDEDPVLLLNAFKGLGNSVRELSLLLYLSRTLQVKGSDGLVE